MNKKDDLLFNNIYNKNSEKEMPFLDIYKKIYNLPIVYSNVTKTVFEDNLRDNFFVLLLIYDDNGRILVNKNSEDNLYELPNGSMKNAISINVTINDILQLVSKEMIIGDVEPVIWIENKFIYNKQEHTRLGLGFIARVRNKEDIDSKKLFGEFVDINDIDEKDFRDINRLASKKLAELFLKRYTLIKAMNDNNFQDEEIIINKKNAKRYNNHNRFMKKFVLTEKRKKHREFKQKIINIVGHSNSIIDISCGEDKFIFNLARELGIKTVVGNDINWNQTEHLSEEYKDMIFTNHTAISLPFTKSFFDVAFCSNTLHHMKNEKVLINMLNSIFEIAKKIVIVEIENPKEIGGFPYWLNEKWYKGYLKDVGTTYMVERQFKDLLLKTFQNRAEIKFDNLTNIMGKYMIAEIVKIGDEK